MKRYKYIIAILAVFCLVAGLTQVSFAADASAMIINNQTIDKITVTGSADAITVANKSYSIKSTDSVTESTCNGKQYTGKTNTITFTNDNYNGWIDITYTISGTQNTGSGGSVTVAAVDENSCKIEDGKIRLEKGGKFTISVKSSSNNKASSSGSYTAVFKPTAIDYEPLTPEISFVAPVEKGSFAVADADGNAVEIGTTAKSSSYTLTAKPDSGYAVFRWIFTASDGTVTYLGEKSNTLTYTASVPGSFTCEFLKSGSAIYEVNGTKYAYFDQALTAAGNSGKIAVTSNGTMFGYSGQTEFTIPNGVTLVLPYSAGQTNVTNSSASYPYANYGEGTAFSAQPIARDSSRTYLLTIPSGTTVKNNGIIAVGGTLQGNAAMNGAHSNLQVNGILELKSNTSVLSAIGYVYGTGKVVANGSGAHIYQPFALLRTGSWAWSVGATGSQMGGITGAGMKTYPENGESGINPSPRFATQSIQCEFTIAYGDFVHAYADQYCEKHYQCNVIMIGTDKSNSLIALHEGATLTSTYDANKTSSTYANVGKQTIKINGGATLGKLSLSLNGITLDLTEWPMPVPYNYDIELENGTYDLTFDLSLLPGAGLKVASDAVLEIPSGVTLAVFTATNDHSAVAFASKEWGSGNSYTDTTTTYGKYSSYRYPLNSTLTSVSGGTMMANLVVDGILNVKSGAYFGGVVQTNGGGTVIMMGNTTPGTTNKTLVYGTQYVFTRQLGLAGHINDTDLWTHSAAGATVYGFLPQYFDENGELQTMESGKIYGGANANVNTIEKFTYDLYLSSADVSYATGATHQEEDVNAKPVGQWHVCEFVQGDLISAGNCVTKAKYEAKCATCGYVNGEIEGVVDSNVHTGNNHTANVVAVGCTTDGYTGDTVCECGYVVSTGSTIDAVGHNYDAVVVAPTCTEQGYTKHTCANCNDSYKDNYTDALGHTEVIDAAVGATCTTSGLTEGKHCSVCGEVLVAQEAVDALGHTEVIDEAVGATCTKSGLTEGKHCSVCEEVLVAQTVVEAKGHTDGETVVENNVAPDCENAGSYDYVVYCTVCGEELSRETVTVPAKGHNVVTDAAVDPTYNNTGLTEGKHCDVCDKVLVAQEVIPMLQGVASVGGVNYGTLADAIAAAAQNGETVKLLATVETGVVVLPEGVVLDLNCQTITATIVGKVMVNGGTWITYADDGSTITMAAPNGAAMYHTDDAVIVLDAQWNLTVESGSITLASNWRTMPNQLVTLNEGVKFVIPEDKTFTILCDVVLNGTVINNGSIVLGEADATLNAPEGLTITTTAGNCVLYSDGKYVVHTHDYSAVLTAPTCTAAGYTTYTCSCGDSYVADDVAALGHNEVIDAAVGATCTTSGLTEGKHCSVCEEVLVAQTVVDALGHTWIDATCTAPMTCAVCQATEGDALDHSYNAVVTEPTCTTGGYTTYTCVTCGHIYVGNHTGTLTHLYTPDVVVSPTCTTEGYTTYKCVSCEDSYTTTMDALGHTMGDWIIDTNADCENDGSKHKECVNCDHTETEVIPATGHTLTQVEAKAPTCTEAGYEAYEYCSACDYTTYSEVAATGHDYEAVVTAPTCTAAGCTTYTCSCGDSYVADEVAALGHTEVIDAAVGATCTTSGLTEGKHCSFCGTVTVAQTVVEAKGHELTYVEEVKATTTEKGVAEHWYCAVCGKYFADANGNIEVSYEGLVTDVIKPTLQIVTGPTSQYAVYGDKVTFSIEATGENLTYQWYIMRAGETEFTEWGKPAVSKSFTCKETNHNMQVYCVVTDGNGNSVVSDIATLSVLAITAHPQKQSVVAGDRVTFSVEAIGTGLKYEWYIMRAGETEFTKWGKTDAAPAFTCKINNDGLQVYCVITDAAGNKITSKTATLSVRRFSDVRTGDYFFDAVQWAVENGITTGTTSTTFSPSDGCQRGQMVTFLWRAAGCPEPETTENPFTDIDEGDNFYKAALWAYENNITTVTVFNPYGTVTRWQTVMFLWRAMGCPEPESTENPFTDIEEDTQYYKAALWAYENGITTEATFNPYSKCTRAQIVTFIYRAVVLGGMEILP